ncbi:MAG: hypothetical protein ACP5R4_09830 [Armatimonadota bacterium]
MEYRFAHARRDSGVIAVQCTYCEAKIVEPAYFFDGLRNPICEACYSELLELALKHTDVYVSIQRGMPRPDSASLRRSEASSDVHNSPTKSDV